MKNIYKVALASLLVCGFTSVATAGESDAQTMTAAEQAKLQYEQMIAKEKEARQKQFNEREAQLGPQRKAAKEKIQKLPEKYKH